MKKLLILLGLVGLSSCMSFSDRAMRPVRDSIARQLPEIRLEKEFAVSLGSGMLNFIDLATLNQADVSSLDHVQVAVYKVFGHGAAVDFNRLNFEATLMAKDRRLTWETIVKVREPDEQVWVLVGMNLKRETLEAVAVFSLGRDELVLINVDGDIDEMLDFAMKPAERRHGAIRS